MKKNKILSTISDVFKMRTIASEDAMLILKELLFESTTLHVLLASKGYRVSNSRRDSNFVRTVYECLPLLLSKIDHPKDPALDWTKIQLIANAIGLSDQAVTLQVVSQMDSEDVDFAYGKRIVFNRQSADVFKIAEAIGLPNYSFGHKSYQTNIWSVIRFKMLNL